MWWCVGSGMENHGKCSQFIYTHQKDELYVNLFVASELSWADKKIKITQQTNFTAEEQTKITITEGAADFSMMIRYPSWVSDGAFKIKVNGKTVSFTNHPSSYIIIKRKWKKGDVVNVILPMHNSIDNMPNLPNYIAVMHGTILLGAKTGTEDLKGLVADDGRWSHIASGKKLPVDKAPIIIEDNIASLATKLKPIPGQPLLFTATNVKMVNPINVVFEPFYKIHNARYMIYWLALSNAGYQSYLDSIADLENQKLALEKRTIDFVAPGEQQPEADHFMQKQNSNTGNQNDEFWREAHGNDGYFSYQLSTNNETGLSLFVRYWGAEWGSRKFDIYIDDQKLITEDNTGKWNQSKFQNVVYAIPDSMIKGKDKVRIKFQVVQGNTAGAVYYIRLIK